MFIFIFTYKNKDVVSNTVHETKLAHNTAAHRATVQQLTISLWEANLFRLKINVTFSPPNS